MNRKVVLIISASALAAAPLVQGATYTGAVLYPLTLPTGITSLNINCGEMWQAAAGGQTVGSGMAPGSAMDNNLHALVWSGPSGTGADSGNPAGLATGTIEIMYTLLGDANLDGKVNGTDFTIMAANFNKSVTAGWDKGDFDYSATVNGSDFVLLADNFNKFASQSAVSSADWAALDSFAGSNGISLANVPEPASVGMTVMAGLGILRRRRRSLRALSEITKGFFKRSASN